MKVVHLESVCLGQDRDEEGGQRRKERAAALRGFDERGRLCSHTILYREAVNGQSAEHKARGERASIQTGTHADGRSSAKHQQHIVDMGRLLGRRGHGGQYSVLVGRAGGQERGAFLPQTAKRPAVKQTIAWQTDGQALGTRPLLRGSQRRRWASRPHVPAMYARSAQRALYECRGRLAAWVAPLG